MGGIKVLFDEASGTIGRVLESSELKPPSVEIIRGPGILAVHDKVGKGKPILEFASIRFLKYAAKDFLLDKWANERDHVVALALSEFGESGGSATEVAKKLNEEPCALSAEPKIVEQSLKRLAKAGSVKADEHRKSKFRATSEPGVLVPAHFDWVLSDAKTLTSPKKDKAPKEHLHKISDTEQPKVEPEVEQALPILSFVETFLAQISGQTVGDAEGYLQWLRSPFAAAREIQGRILSGTSLSCKKASRKHFEVLALLPPALISPADKSIHRKALADSALALIGRIGAEEILGESWFRGQLQSLADVTTGTTLPDQELIAAGRILEAIGAEAKISAKITNYLITDSGFKKRVLEAKKTGADALKLAIEGLATRTPQGGLRLDLLQRVIRDFKIDISFDPFMSDGQPEHLRMFLELVSSHYPPKRELAKVSAVARINELVPHLSKLEPVLEVLAMIETYGLQVEADNFGKALRRSLTNSANAKYLIGSVSGDDEIRTLGTQVLAQSEKLTRLESENTELRIASSVNQVELERLQKSLLSARESDQSSMGHEERAAQLPIVKAMAKILSASFEFLSDQSAAITRLTLIAEQVGLSPIGAPGDSLPFDPEKCEDPDGILEKGGPAVIHTVGFVWSHGDQDLVVLKARVTQS